jgi:hypothetical protein
MPGSGGARRITFSLALSSLKKNIGSQLNINNLNGYICVRGEIIVSWGLIGCGFWKLRFSLTLIFKKGYVTRGVYGLKKNKVYYLSSHNV